MSNSPRPLASTGAISGVLEALAFFRDADFARGRFERYGDVFETKLLGQQLVFIRGERAITDLLSQPEATEGWWPESVRQLLGSRSLANRNGADHRARRRVVGQLFSAAALRRYLPEITTLVEELASELRAASEPVALVERMRRFAFAVIAEVVLGLERGDSEALFADFEIWTRALFSVPIALPGSPFARALQARSRLLERLRGVLERAQERPTGGLDLLSGGVDEVGLPLTDADLVEQLLLLLFAGYETTASSLSCLMAALLQHPEEMAWLQEEISTLAWPTAEGEAAPRLTAVVQVALAASNRLGAKGADDLDAFRPQRHLVADNGLTLLPFGGGDRVCLGKALAELEIRLMTVGLLGQCQLQLVPNQDLRLAPIPSPSPRDGLLVLAGR